MVNWNDYRYLFAIEAGCSLAGAARRLGVSQPTVARRIDALAQDLNIPLLERHADGVRLSKAGRLLCEQARQLQRQAELLELNARDKILETNDHVHITAPEGLACNILIPIFAQLQLEHPTITVDISTGNQIVDMRRGEADVALRFGDPVDENLIGRKLGVVTFGLFAHESYLSRMGTPNSLADLSDHAIIGSLGDLAQLPQAVWLRQVSVGARVTSSSNSGANQIAALYAGLGLLTMATYMAIGQSGLVRLAPKDYNAQADIWLLLTDASRNRPAVRTVVDRLKATVPNILQKTSEFNS